MNIINAVFGGNSRYCTTRSVFQIDKGDVLRFVGLDLPEYYEVHFSNSKQALATRVLANGDSVVIPWEFMRHGQQQVFAWIYLTPDAQTGYTPYQVTIPLNLRSDISESQPTPAQEDIVGEAIAALNEGVTRAENAADDAEEATRHYPRIVNGYWQVWDVEAQAWVDTGVKAVGEDGDPGRDGVDGKDGADGQDGAPGVTYTPTVSADGEISWTNDGGLPNPQPRNIMGPTGATGATGATGPAGKSAYSSAVDGGYIGTEQQFNADLSDVSNKLSLAGGTMTGAIAMGGNKVTGLANGTNAQDAVTKAQLDAAVIGALKPSGSIAFASLPALTASVLNNVYNITDAFTTTSDFVEGAGKTYPAGSNVAIINVGTELTPVYKYDVYTGIIDLSPYRTASDQDVIDAGKLSTTGDGSNVTATFSTASSRTNISTGEKLSVLFGKIAKWFADLGTAAFRATTNAITQGSTDLIESGAVYTGLAAKQGTINTSGLLKGDGVGGVSAATPGTDYVPPSDYAPDSKTAVMTQPVGKDTSGKLWTEPGGAGGVTDVQVNGTSVVQNGVANVPLADYNVPGAFKSVMYTGLILQNGFWKVNSALIDLNIKPGNTSYQYVPTAAQHISTFFGLAKAAGADMAQIAQTTVGVYPEAQKSAISQMLNGPVTVTGTTPTITALPGIRYVCGEVTTLDITLPASGVVDVTFESGSTPTVLTITPPTGVTLKWANGFDPTSLDADTTYEINIADGLGVAASWT